MSELTPKQQIVAIHLGAGDSKAEAARKAGVSRTTVWRWWQKEGFQAAVKGEVQKQIEALRAARNPIKTP